MERAIGLRRPSISARALERGLAALLLGLVGTYLLGRAVEGVVPPLHVAGVVAVHLAVAVGLAFLAAIALHGAVTVVGHGEPGLRRIEVGTAVAVGGCLLVAGVRPQAAFAGDLSLAAAAGALALAGFVLSR